MPLCHQWQSWACSRHMQAREKQVNHRLWLSTYRSTKVTNAKYLVPVLSVAASFRSVPKKRQHTMPKAPLGPAYSPPPRSNCAAKKLCQRQQRVRLPLRHQHFVKMMDSLPRAIVYDWREPLHQRPAVERLAPHHVPLTVVMRQLVVRQHRVCLLGLLGRAWASRRARRELYSWTC